MQMKIGIFGSDYQAGKQNSIKQLFDLLHAKGASVYIENHFHNYLTKQFAFTPIISGNIGEDPLPLDMVISLGGDGTFLRTAAWVSRQNIPILGINTGRLGFLANIETKDIVETIEDIYNNEYEIEERSLLTLKTDLPYFRENNNALNEIAILKRDTSSMITIRTYLNDEFLADYQADGLLVATPTGSTAYSMSVNGPIILPQANNFVLSPVAPHSLNVRPLVIPENYKIRLHVESRNQNFLVALDGRSEVFPTRSAFEIQKANFKIRIIKRTNQTFFDTLRKKLYWGSDVRTKS